MTTPVHAVALDVRLRLLATDRELPVDELVQALADHITGRTAGPLRLPLPVLTVLGVEPLRRGTISVREAARRLGVHENTVRNWAKRNVLRDVRVPGTAYHRFSAADVEALVEARSKGA